MVSLRHSLQIDFRPTESPILEVSEAFFEGKANGV
jgi:hypothetical protein